MLLVFLTVHSFATYARSQDEDDVERDLQVRVGARVMKDVGKDWTLWLSSEVRTEELDPDRYLLEVGNKYEPVKYIALRAEFRGDLKESEKDHGYRPGASVTGSLPIGDFKPSFRFLYTYDFGPDRDERHRVRYRGKLDYDVPNLRLEVAVAAEAFRRLDDRGFYKMRYSLSFDYEIEKSRGASHAVYAGYMLDYFLDKPRDVLIPEVGYKLGF